MTENALHHVDGHVPGNRPGAEGVAKRMRRGREEFRVRIVGQRALAQQITGDASHRFAHQACERIRRVGCLRPMRLMWRVALAFRCVAVFGLRRISVPLMTSGAINGPSTNGASKSFSRSTQCARNAATAAALTGTVRCLRRLPTMLNAHTVTPVCGGAVSLAAAVGDDLVIPLAEVLASPPELTTASLRFSRRALAASSRRTPESPINKMAARAMRH
ncbi:hypothetical protein [Caballeronia sp. dw_19]|uniref:hypothetical protein n=1 Tax=Caballeronia sp. dw_19 TaxID=2719791 RepID=UPI0021028D19|nr:hypothetical protein [Caballeronia sp. dw_19]